MRIKEVQEKVRAGIVCYSKKPLIITTKSDYTIVFNSSWAVVCGVASSVAVLGKAYRLRNEYDRIVVAVPKSTGHTLGFRMALKSWGMGLMWVNPFAKKPEYFIETALNPLPLSERKKNER